MILRLSEPGADATTPRRRIGLNYKKVWTLSQIDVDLMALSVDRAILLDANKFGVVSLREADERVRLEAESGIYVYGWLFQEAGTGRRDFYFEYNYSKAHFAWDETRKFPVPRDPSKYVMTNMGWDWKAAPLYHLEARVGWATETAVMTPPRPWPRQPPRRRGLMIKQVAPRPGVSWRRDE